VGGVRMMGLTIGVREHKYPCVAEGSWTKGHISPRAHRLSSGFCGRITAPTAYRLVTVLRARSGPGRIRSSAGAPLDRMFHLADPGCNGAHTGIYALRAAEVPLVRRAP
jgi:hypothetical protein